MPYQIRKKDNKWCVYNKDTGEDKGCSDTRAMATKHMRALYANAGEKDYHPDVDYLNSYISYCNMLIESAQRTFMYSNDEHEELASFSERLIDDMSGYLDQLVTWRNEWYGTQESLKETSIASKVLDGLKGMLGLSETKLPQTMTLTKQADGRTRVMLRVSNIYKDRHGEIITTAAHKEYEAYVEESKEYPEFWLWHTPGSRWGKADLVSFDDGFLTMSGLVDQGKEYIAEGLAARQGDLGVSHGFKYIKLGEDTIDWYRSFEASPLPREHAANTWTGMMLAKEWEMGLAERQKKFFTTVGVPENVIAEWDSGSKDLAAQLKEMGIEYKEVEPVVPTVATETPTTQAPAVESQAAGTEQAVLAELKKLNERFDAVEAKQKDLEQTVKDSVAQTMAASIIPGATGGFVASKQGEKPTEEESKTSDAWLAELIIGGK